MDIHTLKALEGAITKWREIAAGKKLDLGTLDCPLCEIFYTYQTEVYSCECIGCPVYEKTGKEYCSDTPYAVWISYGGRKKTADTPKLITAAKEEIRFLESLLPEKLQKEHKTDH